jgi:putative spermidine/putrescine transport system substrate-binding protein
LLSNKNLYLHFNHNTKALSKTIIAIILTVIIIVAAISGAVLYYQLTKTSKPTITVAIWGGAWETGAKAALAGFENAYNVKINYYIQSDSLETVQKEVTEASHPTIDVILTGPSQAMTGIAAGVVQPLDPSIVTNLADITPTANLVINGSTYFAGNSLNFFGIAVRTDKINASDVTSWKWLWDSSLAPKKLGVPTPTYYGMPIVASYAWYGDQYHNALNESWAKIETLAPNIGLAYDTDSVASEALSSGTINALVCYQTVAYSLIQSGAPVAFIVPKDQPTWLFPNGPIAIKNGPAGTKLQMELINWLLSANGVSAYCAGIAANPTNANSTIPTSMIPYMLSPTQLNTIPPIDYQYYAQNSDSWSQTWDSTIKPLL